MGSIAVVIPLARTPKSDDGLLAGIWEQAERHMRGQVGKAGQLMLRTYAAEQASDALDSGDWFVARKELFFAFRDAAGLCTCEMAATRHWFRLAVLDQWNEIGALIAGAGGAIGDATKLAKENDGTIIFAGPRGRLSYAEQSDEPSPDAQIFFVGGSTTLGELAAKERSRVTALLRAKRCACEACEHRRVFVEPASASPRRVATKTSKSALRGPIVAVQTAAALAKHRDVVALDLGAKFGTDNNRVGADVMKLLPSLRQLRALGLARLKLAALPDPVLECANLEVLSLAFTERIRFGTSLAKLSALRGIQIDYNPRGTKTKDLEILCSMPHLEIIDDVIWSGALPASFAAMTNLRHATLSPHGACRPLRKMPLESVETYEVIPDLKDAVLRHFEGPAKGLPADRSRLQSLATNEALPARSINAPKLRLLDVTDECNGLPNWLADCAELTFLSAAVRDDADPKRFSVLAELENLRVLSIHGHALPKGLDLSKLKKLEILEINGALPSEDRIPKGLGRLEKLRSVTYEARAWLKGLPLDALRSHLPPSVELMTERHDELDLLTHHRFRALCTDRSTPEWWLARFARGEAFEKLADAFGG